MKLAVAGGGLFGCTAAIYAARAGHDVHLFEAKHQLMAGATASSFYRLHRGFHYPRSSATGLESRQAEKSFRAEYGSCVIDGGRQLYVVPEDDRNHVTVDDFRAFLDNEGLSFAEEGGVFSVAEPRVNVSGLAALVRQKVRDAGVKVHLGTTANAAMRDEFDQIIVATYAHLNETLFALDLPMVEYKFQVVERPIALLPQAFKDTSVVVIDGPYGCVDPLDDTPLHMIGHVTESIHASNVGWMAEVPEHLAPLIDQGLIRNPSASKFKSMVDDLGRYVPGVEKALHVGSSFVIRSVLANVESTDERPTLVKRCDDQVLQVFSGKLGTACRAAADIVAMLGEATVSDREMVAA
jgi:hypothetical protein